MAKQDLKEHKDTSRYRDLVRSLINSLELRNPYNVDHCRVVARLCEQMSRKADLSKESRQLVIEAAELHTLGVSLQMEEKKPYFSLPITNLGLASGREHPSHIREEQLLRQVLGDMPGLDEAIDVIIHRHEWFDGSASLYDRPIELSEETRLLAVADAFVELCTPKKHRPPETSKEALSRISEGAGSQFDPKYVEILKSVMQEQDGFFKESSRAAHFETSRCRHYLYLGHLSIAMHETAMALSSYLRSEKMAVEMSDSGLQLAAISGQVMVYCAEGQLELAREALQRARARTHSEREKRGYHLMWGLVEWLSGREKNGYEILNRLAEHYRKDRNLPALTASVILQSFMLLTRRGLDDIDHEDTLEEFIELVARYDLFDIVERYRAYTVPLFFSAMVKNMEVSTARSNLTKMGEPCQGAVIDVLREMPPAKWMDYLLPEQSAPTIELPLPAAAPEGEPVSKKDTPQVIIHTLGGVKVSTPKGTVTEDDWPTQKALRLLARLAVSRTPISVDSILEDLWPQAPDKKARNSLRNAIHQVRSALKDLFDIPSTDLLQKSRKTATCKLGFEYVLDTEQLEEYLSKAQQASEAGSYPEAVALAQQAVELYQGELLEGFSAEWLDGMRARAKELEHRALGTLGQAYLKAEMFEEAEEAARRMLAADDLREEAYEIQIKALVGEGRSADAIRYYEHAVDLFEREIGVAPAGLTEVLKETGLML